MYWDQRLSKISQQQNKITSSRILFCHLCIISPTLYHSDIASTLGNSKTGSSISKKSIEQVVWVAMKRATSNRYSGHASLFRAFLHKSVFNDILFPLNRVVSHHTCDENLVAFVCNLP